MNNSLGSAVQLGTGFRQGLVQPAIIMIAVPRSLHLWIYHKSKPKGLEDPEDEPMNPSAPSFRRESLEAKNLAVNK